MDSPSARAVLALAVAADAARGRPDDRYLLALRARRDDLEPAARALLADTPTEALQFVSALSGFWQDEGLVDEGRALTQLVLDGVSGRAAGDEATLPSAAAKDGFAEAVAAARTAASELAFRQGDQLGATREARLAIESAAGVGDGAAEAMAWLMLARVAFRDGDAAGIEDAAARAEAVGGHSEMVRRGALHMQAWAAHTAGDLPEARRRFEASLAYRRDIGAGPLSEAVEVANIAELDLDGRDLGRAAAGFRIVLASAAELDNVYLLVNTVPTVAALAAAAGRDEEAAVLFGAADALQASSGLLPDPGGDRMADRTALAERLGALRFGTAVEAGRALDTPGAVARAARLCDDVASASVEAGS